MAQAAGALKLHDACLVETLAPAPAPHETHEEPQQKRRLPGVCRTKCLCNCTGRFNGAVAAIFCGQQLRPRGQVQFAAAAATATAGAARWGLKIKTTCELEAAPPAATRRVSRLDAQIQFHSCKV